MRRSEPSAPSVLIRSLNYSTRGAMQLREPPHCGLLWKLRLAGKNPGLGSEQRDGKVWKPYIAHPSLPGLLAFAGVEKVAIG